VNLLEAAAGWQAGMVLLSTSRVYSIPALSGVPLVERAGLGNARAFAVDAARPLPAGLSPAGIGESFSTAAPVSLYGATKLAGETLALEYAHAAGTPLVIDRCGVMAGAGQFGRADQGIFSWWIHRWAARKPLTFIGFGGRGLQVSREARSKTQVPGHTPPKRDVAIRTQLKPRITDREIYTLGSLPFGAESIGCQLERCLRQESARGRERLVAHVEFERRRDRPDSQRLVVGRSRREVLLNSFESVIERHHDVGVSQHRALQG
jgi:hypothetical protein